MAVEQDRSIVAERRTLYLRFTSYAISVVGIAFGVLLTWLAGFELGVFLFAFGLLCPLVPVVLKRTRSIDVAAHLFMFLFLGAMSAVAWRTGGISSPAVYALAIGSPMGVLILSVRGSIFWVALTLAELATFSVLEIQGYPLEQLLSTAAHRYITGVSILSIVLLLHLLLLQYQAAFNEQVNIVSLSKTHMAEARAEAAAAHQAFNKAALVATGTGAEGGLVERMKSESAIGLAALASTREQMQQMHQRNQDIDPRIQTLQERSQRIGAHLETLQRIATKLDIMALNAALEAARFRGTNDGMSPLAEEMRRLSELAIAEVRSIRDDLRDVTEQSQEVGLAAHLSASAAADSSGQLDNLGRSFVDVLDLFEQSTRAAQQARELGRRQLDAITRLLQDDSEERR